MSSPRYVYLVRVAPGIGGEDLALRYFSSGQTAPQTYGGRLWKSYLLGDPPFTYTSEIPLDDGIGGASRAGFGSLVLARDALSLAELIDWYWDGRDVAIWRVVEGAAFEETDPPIFNGVMDTPTFTESTITIPLRDLAAVLDAPAQIHTYLGTGGYEGYAELAGVTKPLVIGRTLGFEPVALDHTVPPASGVTSSRVVQINDGPLDADLPFFVSERGRSDFTIDPVGDVYAWPPVEGHVAVDFARGVARLGTPPQGVITVDAYSAAMTHAEVMEELLTRTVRILPSEIDTDSLAAFHAYLPPGYVGSAAPVGVTITDQRTVGEVLDVLAQSAGAFWTFTPQRKFQVRVIGWSAPVATIREDRLTEPLRHVPQPPPAWRYQFGYGPIERALTDTDIGETEVAPTQRAIIQKPWRYSLHESTTVRENRLLARDLTVTSRFPVGNSIAFFEGQRQATLLRHDRHGYVATTRAPFGTFTLGDTVVLEHSDYGLSAGKQFLVRKLTELPGYAADEDRAELELWGPRHVSEGG